MAVQLFTNNAASQLSGTLPQGGTTLVCSAGQGAKFPTPIGGDFFYLTLYTKDVYANEQEIEVVKVTARATDTFTIERDIELITGQSGGFAYNGGTTTVYLEMRWTAGCVANLVQKGDIPNVDNTSDLDKPVSTAQATAIGLKLDASAAYVHPVNHAPSVITQDSSNRFVTDAEKTAWDAKQETLVSATNIKTVGGISLLGSGDISIGGSDTSAASSIYSASNFRGF